MAANIPDMGAINTLGGQFTHNVFEGAQKHFNKKSEHQAKTAQNVAKQTASARNNFANSAAQGIKQGRTQFVRGQQQQQTAAKKAAAAHAAGVKSGKVAPAQGAPPRTFAMAPTPQAKAQAKQSAAGAKTMQQQRNFAHGQALNYQAAQFRVQQQQRNNAHGQAIQQQKQMSKPTKGGPVNKSTAPSLTPMFSSQVTTINPPVQAKPIPATSFSSQLTPQKPLAKPQGTPTASFSSGSGNGSAQPSKAVSKPPMSPQFSSGSPVQPKSMNPSFSSAASPAPRNLTPGFSHGPSQGSQKGPVGNPNVAFSHNNQTTRPSPKPSTGQLGAQFSG